MADQLVRFVQDLYRTKGPIPLHAPVFKGREREYVVDTIESTFVSSVGSYVDRFESEIAQYTGAECAVATVNGTAALHVALQLAGVGHGDLVITQPLTFVATCNAIAYCAAEPVFVDVDRNTLGLSPRALDEWLRENAMIDDLGVCRARADDRVVRACVPMHTFGHPADLHALIEVCDRWRIALIEDAAESLGSTYHGRHTGTFGMLGTLSFNGNKLLTTGGGGMILTSHELGKRAKHLTTTAKQPHAYEYVHDEVGYNYRLPNLNAALGCAQLEQLERFVSIKREIAGRYQAFFKHSEFSFVREPEGSRSNYWLNAILCADRAQRDELLQRTNRVGVMTRPVWTLMNHLPSFQRARRGPLNQAQWFEDRVVNLPSGVTELT